LTLKSLSEEPHIVEIIDALRFIPGHPGGVGMGMVAPKGALYLINTEPLFHAEGSLFQIMLEWGISGIVLWAAFWILALRAVWGKLKRDNSFEGRILLGVSLFGWIGALVTFLFLPLMQSVNLMVFLWYLLGASVGFEQNSSVRNSKILRIN
jgi:O-antigen ligase